CRSHGYRGGFDRERSHDADLHAAQAWSMIYPKTGFHFAEARPFFAEARPFGSGSCSKQLRDVELPVADHGPDSIVRTKILRALDIQQGAQLGACAIDAALDGADRASADLRRVFVGEP